MSWALTPKEQQQPLWCVLAGACGASLAAQLSLHVIADAGNHWKDDDAESNVLCGGETRAFIYKAKDHRPASWMCSSDFGSLEISNPWS